MLTALRVALQELRVLSFTPIAWLLVATFAVHMGSVVFDKIQSLFAWQEIGYQTPQSYTYVVFSDYHGLFDVLRDKVYLYIPLLTMGLVSKELRSGTIDLVLSSPTRISEYVLGKFLAVAVISAFLFAVLLILVVIAQISIPNLDFGLAVAGAFGIYLLILAYAAIGLFMSTLTSHELLAALGTLVVLAVLTSVANFGQSIPVVNNLTYWLSLQGRTETFASGLISSKHTIYFLIVAMTFLAFAVLRLATFRESVSKRSILTVSALVLGSAFSLGYLTSRPGMILYHDATRGETMTLSAESQEVMRQLDGDWHITWYANVLDKFGPAGFSNVKNMQMELYEPYTRFNPKLTMSHVLYFGPSPNTDLYATFLDMSDEELARRWALSAPYEFEDVQPLSELSKESDIDFSKISTVLQEISWNGRSTLLPFYTDAIRVPNEREISAALKRLVSGAVTVGVLTGRGERNAFDAHSRSVQRFFTEPTFRSSLVNQGFEIQELPIESGIPETIEILVVADPEDDYDPDDIQKLQNYISSGGNLLLAIEPGRQSGLNSIFNRLGVERIDAGETVDGKSNEDSKVVGEYSLVDMPRPFHRRPVHREQRPIVFSGTARFELKDASEFTAYGIVEERRDNSSTSELLAVAMDRSVADRRQRIVAIGDADFLSNSGVSRGEIETDNVDFALDVFRWLSDGRYPLETVRRDLPPDSKLSVTMPDIRKLKVSYFLSVPLLFVLAGGLLLAARNRA